MSSQNKLSNEFNESSNKKDVAVLAASSMFFGSSATAFIASAFIPVVGPVVMVASAIGGAISAYSAVSSAIDLLDSKKNSTTPDNNVKPAAAPKL